MILEKNSPFMDSRVLVRVSPNFDMTRSADVEVPGTARYWALIGINLQLKENGRFLPTSQL